MILRRMENENTVFNDLLEIEKIIQKKARKFPGSSLKYIWLEYFRLIYE